MRLNFILLTIIASILINVTGAMADGWHTSYKESVLEEPRQQAAIHWDGITETMVLSSYVKDNDVSNYAWFIPILSNTKPIITKGDKEIFKELYNYQQKETRYLSAKSGFGGASGNVKVIEKLEIDVYDILIIKAQNTNELIQWLKTNKYYVPENCFEVLDSYIKKSDCYFVINKIDLKNKHNAALDFIKRINNKIDNTKQSPLNVSQVLKQEEKYKKEIANANIKEKLLALNSTIEQLQSGLATPLKITFKPKIPFFPLHISSLNRGSTKINLYVCSSSPAKSNNTLMSIVKVKSIDDAFLKVLSKHFNCKNTKYISEMTYSGPARFFNDDVYFQFESFNKNYDYLNKMTSDTKWIEEKPISGISNLTGFTYSKYKNRPTVTITWPQSKNEVYSVKTSSYSLIGGKWKKILKDYHLTNTLNRRFELTNLYEVNGKPILIMRTPNYADTNYYKFIIYKENRGVNSETLKIPAGHSRYVYDYREIYEYNNNFYTLFPPTNYVFPLVCTIKKSSLNGWETVGSLLIEDPNDRYSSFSIKDSIANVFYLNKNQKILLQSKNLREFKWDSLPSLPNKKYNVINAQNSSAIYSYDGDSSRLRIRELVDEKWKELGSDGLPYSGLASKPFLIKKDSSLYCLFLDDEKNSPLKFRLYNFKNEKWKYLGLAGVLHKRYYLDSGDRFSAFIDNGRFYIVFIDDRKLRVRYFDI